MAYLRFLYVQGNVYARVLDSDAPAGRPKSARILVGKLVESKDNLPAAVQLARRAVDLAHKKAGMAAPYNVGEVDGDPAVVNRVAKVFVPAAARILRSQRRRNLSQGECGPQPCESPRSAPRCEQHCGGCGDAEETDVCGEPAVVQHKGKFRVCLEGPSPLSKKHRAVSMWLDSAAEADAVMSYGLSWLADPSVQPALPADDKVLQCHCKLLAARIDMAVSAANGSPWRSQPEIRCKTCGSLCSPSSCAKCSEAAEPWVYVKSRQPRWRDVEHHDILAGRLSRYYGVYYDKVKQLLHF